ncbi:MAG: hypothetical protein WBN14_16185, partial [Polyangiales bacterium]
SMHQKHPPAKVAFASLSSIAGALAGLPRSGGESARVDATPTATKMATRRIGIPHKIVRQLFIAKSFI